MQIHPYLNKYVYCTDVLILNDILYPNETNKIYYVKDVLFDVYKNFALIQHPLNTSVTIWVGIEGLTLVPKKTQKLLKALYEK